jgi:hypothetical protein
MSVKTCGVINSVEGRLRDGGIGPGEGLLSGDLSLITESLTLDLVALWVCQALYT